MSGYVRIHRSLIGHPSFRNDAEAMAFAWMVMRASWRPCRVRYKEHPINLDRGQLAISVRDFAAAMDRDKAWIERLLKRLKSEAMIETAAETGVTVVTICKYDEYQSDGATSETASETPRETGARQGRDTEQRTEEGKKEREETNVSSARGRRAAVDFPCPDGVGAEHWRDFLANRKAKRLTNSATAYQGILRSLAELSNEEWPPGRLVQHAAERGWGSINEPRDRRSNHNGRKPQSDHRWGSTVAAADDLIDQMRRTGEPH